MYNKVRTSHVTKYNMTDVLCYTDGAYLIKRVPIITLEIIILLY